MLQVRLALPAVVLLALAQSVPAQQQVRSFDDAGETRAALARARGEAQSASARADRLEATARTAREAAAKTAAEAAALAARIQQSEAGIAAARARIALASQQHAALDERLAIRRGPLIRLTAGLQKLARRPLALSVLRPGSLRDTVHLRAVLATTIPEVRRRTAALRGEIAREQQIESESRSALAALHADEGNLSRRREALAALETHQRLASRAASGAAAREAERALALAEQARDLDGLVGQLDAAGSLRRQLAALPGPLIRPARPEASEVIAQGTTPAGTDTGPAPAFQLPVVGRTVTGFGEASEGGVHSAGIALAPGAGAQVVSPGAGRVVFAGPFRGFDRIVIVEHPGGFTSLVTGLGRIDVSVGDQLVAGSPLGVSDAGRPVVGFELRRDGKPVNPTAFLH